MAKKTKKVTNEINIIKNKSLEETVIEKRAELEYARTELKKKFVGIDDVIDKFISSIESWYIFPELRTKPLIVNMWGITGVGKTALVRAFVKLIKKEKDYAEISTSGEDTYCLSSVLDESGITCSSHAIVLIDEFQTLRTKNEKDEEITSGDLIDLWSFLSDGSFPVPFNMSNKIQDMLDCVDEHEPIPMYISVRAYNVLKRANPAISLQNVRDMKPKEFIDAMKNASRMVETYSENTFNKLLVIIAGNLDEAFYFADDVANADVEADEVKKYSHRIKMTDIKQALLKRFRPEQISRLGNTHIIYPVLGNDDYNKLIEMNVKTILDKYNETFKSSFTVDDSVIKAIYSNGVFPMQGVRPVISTITTFVENPLAYFSTRIVGKKFTNAKLLCKDKTITIDVECTDSGNETFTYDISDTLDECRKLEKDYALRCAIHEAGHAVIESTLTGYAPRQIVVGSSLTDADGFCSTVTNLVYTKTRVENAICTYFGGLVAEEIVFGKNNRATGPVCDLSEATALAYSYINEYCMTGSHAVRTAYEKHLMRNNDNDSAIELLLEDQCSRAKNIIMKNKKFFEDLVDNLVKNNKLNDEAIIKIAKKYKIELKKTSQDDNVDVDTESAWNKFKKKSGWFANLLRLNE